VEERSLFSGEPSFRLSVGGGRKGGHLPLSDFRGRELGKKSSQEWRGMRAALNSEGEGKRRTTPAGGKSGEAGQNEEALYIKGQEGGRVG